MQENLEADKAIENATELQLQFVVRLFIAAEKISTYQVIQAIKIAEDLGISI